jgi:hypothetical protein
MGTKRNFKVRFHLAQGVNYMKWQIRDNEGNVIYLEPSEVSLSLHNCKLINRPSTAKKIHEGANKSVCAWVECEGYTINTPPTIVDNYILTYNPRVAPNWNLNGNNVDGQIFEEIETLDRSLHLV